MLLIHLIIMQMCKPVPKMVPTVSCETRMKEIELKEICIDIDIQLPRFSLMCKMLLLLQWLLLLLLRLLMIFAGRHVNWPQCSQGGVQAGGEGGLQVDVKQNIIITTNH